ncbi:tyrosine-type recombinase/integrase [Peribacillus butanolivorans]|uniref:tyrosine-type recombinase/integrase n=1 Tax=Peribacillus butanolivorans TaxID=421767 RepID=UPI0036494061
MVNLIRSSEECIYIKYLFLDKHERVIEYPTLFINSRLNNARYSPQTVYQYSKVLKYFCCYLERNQPNISVDDSLRAIEGNFIDTYIKKMSYSGLKAATIRNRDAIIKEFMVWLTSEESGKARENSGYIESKLKSAKPSRCLPKYVVTEEVIRFLSYLHDENQRCLVHFLYDTGVRISEVPRMKLSDLPDLSKHPLEANYFKLHIEGSKGRGGQIKPRDTYVTRTMIERIHRLHQNNKVYLKALVRYKKDMPLFLNVFGELLTNKAISDLIYKAKIRSEMNIHAHRFRHGFAMSILASEMDNSLINKLVMIKEALGHEDIQTTQIYSSIAPQVIQKIRQENIDNLIPCRFEEAQRIYEETFKPQKNHKEKRGRSKRVSSAKNSSTNS